MNKHHSAAIFITLIACFLVMFGLFNAESRALGSGSPPAKYRIQMILKAKANPPDFWRIVELGAMDAAEEYNADCEVTGPAAEENIDGQIALVERAIRKKPDAVILAAADYRRLAPACRKISDAGIELIMMDSDVQFEGKRCLIATDNVDLGKKLAQQMDLLIGPEEKFGVVGHVKSVTTAMDRERGLRENAVNASARMAGISYCNGSVSLARRQAAEMLQEHPDIRCMVGLNESSALGIAQALLDLGLEGRVKLVACDSSQEMIQMVERGVIQILVVQNSFNMGYLSVKNAVRILQKQDVPPFYDTKSVVVTRKTLYTEENQKLLFPFTEDGAQKQAGSAQSQ